MRRLLLIPVLLILAGAAPAPKKPAKRPAAPPPFVEIVGDFPGPRILHDRTTGEIEAIRKGREPAGWHNPGLTVSEHVLNTRYELGLEQDKPGAPYRAYLTKLWVEFGYTKLEVYVASEYARGTCEYNQVLKHEMEHVGIHASTYRRYKRMLREALAAPGLLPTRKRPLHVRDAAQAQVQVDRKVKGVTTPLYDRFTAELLRAQGRIDTPANYKAIQKRCKGWKK
jgi:hypothetical protein